MRRRLIVVLVVTLSIVLPAPPAAAAPTLGSSTIQTGLAYPWDLTFAPNGRMLVTERPGRIRVYADRSIGGRLLSTTTIPKVRAEGEAGVMGIALTRWRNRYTFVFVCASRQVSGRWVNQVLRYRLDAAGRLHYNKRVLGGMRANTIHNGCAVEIGPDNRLWVSMGDAADLSLPQNRSSRNGKILRVRLGGAIPADNPFRDSPVYALGLRNPQGLAFHPGSGRAYSIEHGPDVHDEINRLRPGRNYGWPCWTGRRTRGPRSTGCSRADAYAKPAWSSGTGGTLATSGGTFMHGRNWAPWRYDLFVPTLKESDLRRFEFNDTGTRTYNRSTLYDGRWGRLRAAVRAPGGNDLYLTTSNGGSDRIIRIRAR